MFVTQLEGQGFGGLPSFRVELDRVTPLDGAPRALFSLVDALLVAFAPLCPSAARQLLARWGCRGVKLEEGPLPTGAQWEGSAGLRAVSGADGTLVSILTIELDPPLFGHLRKEALRDPRLVDALGEGARLELRAGLRLSPDRDAAGFDLLGLRVGGASFAVAGPERPDWLGGFLRSFRGRLQVGGVSPERWGQVAASHQLTEQRALRRALHALRGPPAQLGEVLALPEGPAAVDGDDLVPVHLLGEKAARAAGLVGAVHLAGAEILVVEDPPRGWGRWFAQQALSEGSPLEQVLLVGAAGGAVVAPGASRT